MVVLAVAVGAVLVLFSDAEAAAEGAVVCCAWEAGGVVGVACAAEDVVDCVDEAAGEGEVGVVLVSIVARGLAVEGDEVKDAECVCPEIASLVTAGVGGRGPCLGVGGGV